MRVPSDVVIFESSPFLIRVLHTGMQEMLCGNGVNGTERSQGCCKFGQWSSIPALFQIVYSYSKSTSAELCGHIQLHRFYQMKQKRKEKCACQFRLFEICRCLLWTSSKRFPLNAAFRGCDSIKEPKGWIFRTLYIAERTFQFHMFSYFLRGCSCPRLERGSISRLLILASDKQKK